MRRLRFALTALVLVGTCGAILARPLDGPRRKGEAAIAIRDAVPGYQQFFTERYTVPRLEAGYERCWYFTETEGVRRRAELERALAEATEKYEHVDLFLLAHGNRYIDAVRTLKPEARRRLRLVYDTGGSSAHQGYEWMDLGVGTFVGHPGGNIAPLFYVYFLPEWVKSQDAEKAMKRGNDEMHDWLYGPLGRVVDRDALWEGSEAKLFRR